MENNKIIAEFMNLELGSPYMWRPGSFSPLIVENLLYHKSWDWLIPVVEKILNICAENDDLEKYAVITDNIPYIQQTYDECIKFINFYNKQKEE